MTDTAGTGAADPSFFFKNTGINQTATWEYEQTNFDGNHKNGSGETLPGDVFGWFDTNSTGSSIGTLHPLFAASSSSAPVQGPTDYFSGLTAYYGFYVTDERGTFFTLSQYDTDTPSGNGTTVQGILGSGVNFQHLAVFQQDPNTYWFGIEDLNNSGAFPAGDYEHADQVYMITSTSVPEPATMFLLGSGLIGLAGFARKKFRK